MKTLCIRLLDVLLFPPGQHLHLKTDTVAGYLFLTSSEFNCDLLVVAPHFWNLALGDGSSSVYCITYLQPTRSFRVIFLAAIFYHQHQHHDSSRAFESLSLNVYAYIYLSSACPRPCSWSSMTPAGIVGLTYSRRWPDPCRTALLRLCM